MRYTNRRLLYFTFTLQYCSHLQSMCQTWWGKEPQQWQADIASRVLALRILKRLRRMQLQSPTRSATFNQQYTNNAQLATVTLDSLYDGGRNFLQYLALAWAKLVLDARWVQRNLTRKIATTVWGLSAKFSFDRRIMSVSNTGPKKLQTWSNFWNIWGSHTHPRRRN